MTESVSIKKQGCVALTAIDQQKLRCLFFRRPTRKIALPVTIPHFADAETALSVSYALTQCLPVSFVLAGMI